MSRAGWFVLASVFVVCSAMADEERNGSADNGVRSDAELRAHALTAIWQGDADRFRELIVEASSQERSEIVGLAWENAVRAADADVARDLLELGGPPDPALLESALARGRLDIADLLREHGVRGRWLKNGYNRALERAVRWGWADEVGAALAAGWEEWHELMPETTLRAAVRRHGLRVEALVREDAMERTDDRGKEEEIPLVGLTGYEFLAPPYRPDWAGQEVAVEVVVNTRGRTRMPRTVNIVERTLADYVERLTDGLRVPPWMEAGRPIEKRLVIAVTLLPSVVVREEKEVQQRPAPLRRVRLQTDELRGSKRGSVVLEFLVEPDGTTSSMRIVEGTHGRLGGVAVETMRDWLFHPGFQDGQAVRVRMRLPFAYGPKNAEKSNR